MNINSTRNKTNSSIVNTTIIATLIFGLFNTTTSVQVIPTAAEVFSSSSVLRNPKMKPWKIVSTSSTTSSRMKPWKIVSTSSTTSSRTSLCLKKHFPGVKRYHHEFSGGEIKIRRGIMSIHSCNLHSYSHERERRTILHQQQQQQRHPLAFVGCSSDNNCSNDILNKRTRIATHTKIRKSLAQSLLSTSSTASLRQRNVYYQPRHLFSSSSKEGDTAGDSSVNNNDETDENISTKTKTWIQNVVIGLNLCPFADKPKQQSKLHTTIYRGDDLEEIVCSVLYECIKRQDDTGSTTVVICPDLHPDSFEDYLDVLSILNEILEDYELKDDIQIAPFHPLFEFEDAGKDAVENFTNRSPYPIFHILREEDVAAAVEKLDGDSSKVFQRNIDLLQKMEEKLGREQTAMAMQGVKVEGLKELVRGKDLEK